MEMNLKRAVITDLVLSKNSRIPVSHNYVKQTKKIAFLSSISQFLPHLSPLVSIPPSHFLGQVGIYIIIIVRKQ
jgi:hypothetical protein